MKAASEQLELSVFDGNPLEAAPKNIEPATEALKERNLPVTEENIFLVLAAMVPGKKMETNEGIRLLTGNPKIDIPFKKKEEPVAVAAPTGVAVVAPAITGPVTTRCTVEENGAKRTFVVTLEPAAGAGAAPAAVADAAPVGGTQVFSTFAGAVEIVDILVNVGDSVFKGGVVAEVEAMKAKHDIKAQCDGKVSAIHAKIGDEIDSSKPIMTIV